MLDLKQQVKTPACYCMSGFRKCEMNVVAAGAALVFTTRSNFICRSQFWHFHWNVPQGMFVVTFVLICDALYGSSTTHWTVPQLAPQFCTCPVLFCRSNFVQFCTNFQLAAFLHKTLFLHMRLHISARAAHRRLNAPQWAGEYLCTGEKCAHFNVQAAHLHCAHVQGIAMSMWTTLCKWSCTFALFDHQCAQCVLHVHICVLYMLIALQLLCAPLPWWTIC